MKNKIFSIVFFQLLFIGISFAQLILLGVIKSLPIFDEGNLKRIYVNGAGEKFAYNNKFTNKITVFNMDGSIWKVINKPLNNMCNGIIRTSVPNEYRMNAESGLEFSYSCNFASGFYNFGIADENGKTLAFLDKKAVDIKVVKTGMLTYSSGRSKSDTMQTINFYKKENGGLTLSKTFKTRYIGAVINTIETPSTYYFELGAANNIIRFYDADFNIVKEIKLPFQYPDDTSEAYLWDFSQTSFNNDSNWEFVIWFFTPNGSRKYYLLNDQGKILGQRDFNFDLKYSFKSKRMISTKYDSLTNKWYNFMIELPSQRIIDTIPSGFRGNLGAFSGKIYITRDDNTSFEIQDEQLKQLKLIDKSKESINGYTAN